MRERPDRALGGRYGGAEGPRTAAVAAATKLFDPDLSWARIEVVD